MGRKHRHYSEEFQAKAERLAAAGAESIAVPELDAEVAFGVIAAHYARKRVAGKSPMNALGHCMRKALSIVWGVWRNGQDFDPNWGLEV
jgi:hypothetical protein